MSNRRNASVVFDSAASRALLTIAAREGLLHDDPRKTDGFLDSFKRREVPPWLEAYILEQVVLRPDIVTTIHLPQEGLGGPMIDEGLLRQVEPPKEDLLQVEAFSASMISGMLEARGHSIPEEEFDERLAGARQAHAEVEEYQRTHGENPPTTFTLWFRALLDKVTRHEKGDPRPELQPGFEDARRREMLFGRASPILECMTEYLEIGTLAQREGTRLAIPSREHAPKAVIHSPLDFEKARDSEVALFRVVATELGKLTFRPSLSGSLALARSSPTQAMREQLDLWLQAMAAGRISDLQSIQKEARQAASALERLGSAKRASAIVTYAAFPVRAVSALLALSPQFGIFLSFIGLLSFLHQRDTRDEYQWAMFGSLG